MRKPIPTSHRTHRRNIDTIALQLAANAFADIVITGTGNKRNIRAASPGGDGRT